MDSAVRVSLVTGTPPKERVKWPAIFKNILPGQTIEVENSTISAVRSALRYHRRKGKFKELRVLRRGERIFVRRT